MRELDVYDYSAILSALASRISMTKGRIDVWLATEHAWTTPYIDDIAYWTREYVMAKRAMRRITHNS